MRAVPLVPAAWGCHVRAQAVARSAREHTHKHAYDRGMRLRMHAAQANKCASTFKMCVCERAYTRKGIK